MCVYVALARLEEKRTGLVGKPQDPRTITTDCGVVSKFVLISIVSGVSLIKIIGRLGVCLFAARNLRLRGMTDVTRLYQRLKDRMKEGPLKYD